MRGEIERIQKAEVCRHCPQNDPDLFDPRICRQCVADMQALAEDELPTKD